MATLVVSGGVYDVNETTKKLTNDNTMLIRYHSTAQVIMAVEGQNDTSIEYTVKNGGKTKHGSKCDFENVWDEVFICSAQDSRGNIGSMTVKADMIDYVQLTCNIGSITPDASGNVTLSCYGNYFNGSFGAKDNSLILAYGCADSNGNFVEGEMEDVNIYSNNTYSASINLSGLDYQETYTFYVNAKDELEQVDSTKNGVTTKPMFHWGKNSVGEQDFTFEVPVNFNGPGVMFKGSYIKVSLYNMLIGAMDKLTLYSPHEVELNADSILLNGSTVISNTWTPKLNIQGPSISCTERYGWYQKLGSVVTVGWRLKATIPSGFDDTELSISGVPFEPLPLAYDEDDEIDYDAGLAFGGGVAFGIYTAEDYIFEGWSINANSIIKARLQRCEKYDSGNLQISSHSYYPKGGGQITLGGTICFMTAV